MPKVSIVIPVYNAAEYIEQCARSLFEQTLADIEVVFVDDCSPDNSIDIIRKVLEEYPSRIPQTSIVRNPENCGSSMTRRNGVMAAHGEYVLFVDSDDFIETDTAEKLYNKCASIDADMVLYDFIKYTSKDSYVVSLAPHGVIGDGANLRDELLNRETFANLCSRMVRRSLLFHPDFVWPQYSMAEDVVASSVLMVLAQKITHVAEPLYHYRFNPSSITRFQNEKTQFNKYSQYLANVQILFDFLERRGLSQKYEKGITYCKMAIRNQLAGFTNKAKYRKLWMSTFPELNKMMFWGTVSHPSSYRNKIWYLAFVLGLFPKFRKVLLSKRFRPSGEWRAALLLKPE